jgi:PKD repeat protein
VPGALSRPAGVAAVTAAALAAGLGLPAAAAADAPPVVAFTITPNPTVVGLPVELQDQSTDPDGQIVRREWDLNGDGAFDRPDRSRIVRRYNRARCVVVRLRITDSGGNIVQRNQMLTVRDFGATEPVCPAPPPDPPPVIPSPPVPPMPPLNNAPSATFTVAPAAPRIGEPVTFASTASDPDGSIAFQEWDLNGDGAFGDATGPTAQTTFAAAGAHNVSRRVADDRGVIVVGTVAVTVVDPAVRPPGNDDSDVRGRRQRAPAQQLDATVRLRTRVGVRRTRVEVLSVEAPALSTVTLRCSSSRCPVALSVAQIGTRERTVRFRRTEKQLLYAGTLLQVFVTRPGAIGKYVSFRIRGKRAAPLRRTRCLRVGGMRPYRCPSR